MRKLLRHYFLTIAGYLTIVIGIILFPLPIPLGIPMIAGGVAVLYRASPKSRRRVLSWLSRLKKYKKFFLIGKRRQSQIDHKP